MPALVAMAAYERLVVKSEAKRSVVADPARGDAARESAIDLARALRGAHPLAQRLPVRRRAAGDDLARHRGDDRDGVRALDRAVEENEARQMPAPGGDLGRCEIACFGTAEQLSHRA